MKTIEYLPHISNLHIRIEADTLEELFEAGLKGMSNLLKKDFCHAIVEFEVLHEINVVSNDLTSLLADFLSETLARCYEDSVIFCELSVLELTENNLIATIHGTAAEAFDKEIKAISYHEADVKKNSEGNWETRLIFDI